MGCQEFTKEKTVAEFMTYAKGFEDRTISSKEEAKAAIEKLVKMAATYGFTFYKSFNVYCQSFKNENTTDYYRLDLGDYAYIQLQIGFLYKTKENRTWSAAHGRHIVKGTVKEKFVRGVFRVEDNSKPDLNPRTNRPWAIGDHDDRNGYGRTLTRNGWYTGD